MMYYGKVIIVNKQGLAKALCAQIYGCFLAAGDPWFCNLVLLQLHYFIALGSLNSVFI